MAYGTRNKLLERTKVVVHTHTHSRDLRITRKHRLFFNSRPPGDRAGQNFRLAVIILKSKDFRDLYSSIRVKTKRKRQKRKRSQNEKNAGSQLIEVGRFSCYRLSGESRERFLGKYTDTTNCFLQTKKGKLTTVVIAV